MPLYVAKRAAPGFKAGQVFRPQDKQTIRGFGVSFGQANAWDVPFSKLSYVEVRLVPAEDYARLVTTE